jgi:hypothetical protein
VKWIGTICFLCAALLLSSNIDISRYGFILFLIGHIILTYWFWFRQKDYPMFTQNAFFIGIDVFGIVRWF